MRNSSSLDWLRFMHTPNDYRVSRESMGHNSEKTTRIYLSSLDRSVIDDANAKLISGI